jgi:predicted secreted protein
MRLNRSAASAVVVGAALLALAVAPARAADAAVSLSLYWPADAGHAAQAFVPVGGTVKVMAQIVSDGGFSAVVTDAADPAVFTTSGPDTFIDVVPPGWAGQSTYELWTFTAVAPGTTTFRFESDQAWVGGDKGPKYALTLVARADETVPLDDAACVAGTSTVGVAVGAHVGVRLSSNASTGYAWTEVSVPNTVAFRPDDPQGVYTAPPADAPPGAAGYQTFGYAGLADGSSPIDLAYARAGEAAASTCKPTIAVGVAADPAPEGKIEPYDDQPSPTDQPDTTPPATWTSTTTPGEEPRAPWIPAAALLAGAASAAVILRRWWSEGRREA